MYKAIIDNFDVNTVIYDGISPLSDLVSIVHYKKIGMKAYGQNLGNQLEEVESHRKYLTQLEKELIGTIRNKYNSVIEEKRLEHLNQLYKVLVSIDIDPKTIKLCSSTTNTDAGFWFEVNTDIQDKIMNSADPHEPYPRKFETILDHYIGNKLPFNINVNISKIE